MIGSAKPGRSRNPGVPARPSPVPGRRSGLACLAVLLIAAACVDAGGHVTYRLVLVGSDTLPAVVDRDQACEHVLTHGEVAFSGRQQYESTFNIERRCAGEPAAVVADPGTAGTVMMVRDTAYFLDPDGQRTGFGILTADTLTVQGGIHTLRYYRVRRSSR